MYVPNVHFRPAPKADTWLDAGQKDFVSLILAPFLWRGYVFGNSNTMKYVVCIYCGRTGGDISLAQTDGLQELTTMGIDLDNLLEI